MRNDLEETFDPDQPTLIVTYGNTTRKYRPLDREVILVGRAPSCDLNLVGAEVAPIHCLLLRRRSGGWRVRHFGGRVGTLVNGKPILHEIVDHDDTLQIGSFSFKFHLPPLFRRPGLKSVAVDTPELRHLRRSRRNLVRLALNLRQNLQEARAELARAVKELEQQRHDSDSLRESARAKQQQLDALRAKGDTREQDFLQRCQELERQEAAVAEQLRAAEAEIKAAWDQCRARCRAAEEAAPQHTHHGPVATDEEARRLARRRAELAHYARHLRRAAERAAERDAELDRRAQELGRLRSRLEREQELQRSPVPAEERPASTSTLRERLAKVQKMKMGLAMLRTSDSAPGVAMKAVASAEADESGDTPG
jgi:pSer/pThr/pTyr-binding forkhead associated (FHA) protein